MIMKAVVGLSVKDDSLKKLLLRVAVAALENAEAAKKGSIERNTHIAVVCS